MLSILYILEENMSLVQKDQVFYMTKVLTGLSVLIAVSISALKFSELELSHAAVLWGVGLFVLFFLMLFGGIYRVYKKMDELQQRMHEYASVFTVTFFVSLFGVLGVLQANHIIPLFNQFWMLGALIIIWGVALSFYDKSYK